VTVQSALIINEVNVV